MFTTCHRGFWLIALSGLAIGCATRTSDESPAPAAKATPSPSECGGCCELSRADMLRAQAILNKAKEKSCCCAEDGGAACNAKDMPRSWPLFGGTTARNMVNTIDKDIATEWCVEEDKFKNIKWAAKLGSKSYGGPVIANGKVYVGTNNYDPRDPMDQAKLKNAKTPAKEKTKIRKQSVVMCFNEADGSFVWQNKHPYPDDPRFAEVLDMGLLSTPVLDGGSIYYVTPGGEVIAADAATGKIAWRLDMMAKLGVLPYHCCNCSPLVVGGKLFLITSNGIDEQTGKVGAPKAPSFLALNKDGTIAWQSNLPGDKIIDGQWSNPVHAVVGGKSQIIFPGGDSFLYSFDADTGNLVWKCNADPARPKPVGDEKTNFIVGTPVVHDNKLYVATGVYHDFPTPAVRYGHIVCVDITKKGDVSPVDLDPKNPKNKDSALVWGFGGEVKPKPELGKGRPVYFGQSISTPAVHDGLVYISENAGYMHCLDAKTGQRYWEHDFLGVFWGSPYWVDGKIYIGTEEGEIFIFEHGKNKKLLGKISMEDNLHGTPVVINGVLYVMTKKCLYAIAKGGTAKEPK
jgi:outer membrane protein assembly factor BamB